MAGILRVDRSAASTARAPRRLFARRIMVLTSSPAMSNTFDPIQDASGSAVALLPALSGAAGAEQSGPAPVAGTREVQSRLASRPGGLWSPAGVASESGW